MKGGVVMVKKPVMAEIPVSFRIEQDIHDFIEQIMIDRREFNKSRIHREIFMLGLEEYKKQQNKK